jgi:hypothetical protein
MVNLSTNNKKKLTEWNWKDYWNLAVKKYRLSKKIRKHIKKDNRYDFKGLGERLNVDRHYIYQIMKMNVYPNNDFIKKLYRLKK